MEFKNLKDLEKYLNGKINKALKSEVSTVARETMQEHVMDDVYSKYQPSPPPEGYQRTGNLYKDISTQMVSDNTLVVENVARDEETGRKYAKVVETGEGYQWESSRIYQMQPFPRPFTENTYKELANGKAKDALAEGLKKQGLDVQ